MLLLKEADEALWVWAALRSLEAAAEPGEERINLEETTAIYLCFPQTF